MLRYVHQLVSNIVCLSFCAGRVVYSGLPEFCQLPAAARMNAIRAVTGNQNRKVADWKTKAMS